MAGPVRFRLVPERSTVAIHATSSIHPIDGVADGVTGFVELAVTGGEPDLSVPSTARIELEVDHLSSGNAAYDSEMRRRLDARRFPTIVGELTGVEAGARPGIYRATGDLTFHGVMRTLSADIAVEVDGTSELRAAWEQTIDIRDFDLKPPRVLMLKVHPEVRIEVRLVADR